MAAFTDKVVWITGASSGIGEALAVAFAREGARLVLSSRREPDLQRVATLTGLPPERVLVLPIDMRQGETFSYKVVQVRKYFGRIDIMVHNAGISQRSFARDTLVDVDRKLMEVNYFGPVALTKALLPLLHAQGGGHLVVVSSVVGYFGTPMRSAYAASKHALHGFFESLRAEESGHNIRVTMICPGYIRTNISVNALNERGEKYNQMDDNQANGIPAEECAQKILRAVAANKQEALIGGREVVGVYLKRFVPGLFSKMLNGYNIKSKEV
jgi:short-subunit dehydrogenase